MAVLCRGGGWYISPHIPKILNHSKAGLSALSQGPFFKLRKGSQSNLTRAPPGGGGRDWGLRLASLGSDQHFSAPETRLFSCSPFSVSPYIYISSILIYPNLKFISNFPIHTQRISFSGWQSHTGRQVISVHTFRYQCLDILPQTQKQIAKQMCLKR